MSTAPSPTPTRAPRAQLALPPDFPFTFTPVPHVRARAEGWTPKAQAAFIHALSVMGSVGHAAPAVGLGRASAYRLRDRALALGHGAESFAAAWDRALGTGRWRRDIRHPIDCRCPRTPEQTCKGRRRRLIWYDLDPDCSINSTSIADRVILSSV